VAEFCFTVLSGYSIFKQYLDSICAFIFNYLIGFNMSPNVWIKKPCSFSEARDLDLQYYSDMTPQERLETVQFLREQYFKLKGTFSDESGKGLRRTVRIVQQAQR
jgi:hypothetical protein